MKTWPACGFKPTLACSRMGSSFHKLDSKIQEAVWELGWERLRPLQAEAINAILEQENNLILSAATASGKTEAAFLPILSRIAATPKDSIQALYVSPLVALINDQFGRLEQLCLKAEIPVHRRHGGVLESERRRMINLGHPGYCLLPLNPGGNVHPARPRVTENI
jgi:ATP-dependent helicase Lhr and Lhr-like helicase